MSVLRRLFRVQTVKQVISHELPMLYFRLISPSYEDAYKRYMRWVTRIDRGGAVGGWGGDDELLFSFLKGDGLKPHHTVLDVGCGKLRVGRHLIDYLDSGNYTGMDVSPDALDVGREVVEDEGLSHKEYRLVENDDLRFTEFDGTFDIVLSFEVFTHLQFSQIKECLQNVSRVMHDDSVFYFTFNETGVYREFSSKTFVYDKDRIISLSEEAGFVVREVESDEYMYMATEKPMLKLTRR